MATDAKVIPHIPVLLDTVVDNLAPFEGIWADCTLGAGSYSNAILENGANHVFGIDRDPVACKLSESMLLDKIDSLTIINKEFGDFDLLPELSGVGNLDGVVFDLGVSSMQIDVPERGFAFSKNGTLDMRMSSSGPTAAEVINNDSEERLAAIFRVYGEEPYAKRIAKNIIKFRQTDNFTTTQQLADLVQNCLPRRSRTRTHPATRVFQGLRIYVNNELEQLVRGLAAAERILKTGGKLVVVSFHSLEDRIVKDLFRTNARPNRHRPSESIQTKSFIPFINKLFRPSDDEVAQNPRSRSARLRIGIRTSAPASNVQNIIDAYPRIFD